MLATSLANWFSMANTYAIETANGGRYDYRRAAAALSSLVELGPAFPCSTAAAREAIEAVMSEPDALDAAVRYADEKAGELMRYAPARAWLACWLPEGADRPHAEDVRDAIRRLLEGLGKRPLVSGNGAERFYRWQRRLPEGGVVEVVAVEPLDLRGAADAALWRLAAEVDEAGDDVADHIRNGLGWLTEG